MNRIEGETAGAHGLQASEDRFDFSNGFLRMGGRETDPQAGGASRDGGVTDGRHEESGVFQCRGGGERGFVRAENFGDDGSGL